MFARDASINRVLLGPKYIIQVQPLVKVAGQIPILSQTVTAGLPTVQAASSPGTFSSSASTPQADVTSSSQPEKIPRPPNAFILYRKFHHASILRKNPGIHNNRICKYIPSLRVSCISDAVSAVIIGAMWNGESAQVRADFQSQADKLKLEHRTKHPNYQYRPRKPAEKKRRMTKKKAAAMADAAENTAKSMEIVDQYAAAPRANQRLHTSNNGCMTLPSSDLPATDTVLQQYPYNNMPIEDAAPELPYHLSPSANYVAAQEQDMQFFGEIDSSEAGYQALAAEVREAFEAGYYDDALIAGYTTLNDAVDATLLSDKDYRLGQYGI